jgi:hypothetical protein
MADASTKLWHNNCRSSHRKEPYGSLVRCAARSDTQCIAERTPHSFREYTSFRQETVLEAAGNDASPNTPLYSSEASTVRSMCEEIVTYSRL